MKLKRLGSKAKAYYRLLDQATKVRFTSADLAEKIKNGTLGTKGLVGSSKYQNLSIDGQTKAFAIVDEECGRQELWKPKELRRVALIIEQRLKAECV